jgi:hypothetical protein
MKLAKVFVLIATISPCLVLACWSNLDCELGSKCLKVRGDMYGICAGGSQPGNSNDREPVTAPMDRNNTYGNTCSSDFDCGLGSTCFKERGHMDGVCVKKR